MFFDYHIHSKFSTDSKMTLEEICEQSILIGLEEIAITDHHDIDYQDPSISFEIDRHLYLSTLEEFQAKYQGKLRIKKGLELGLQPHILDKCAEFAGDHFDFVLASFHTAQKKDLYTGKFFEGYTQWEAYREYLKEVHYCVERFDHFSVVGHLDVIRRYGDFPVIPDLMDDSDCRDLIEEILKILVEKGKGLEVNTSGYHYGNRKDPLPSRAILRLYRELGGEILTTGSDSHYKDQLGYKFKETHEMLKDLGFKYLTTFEKGKPIFHKIK
ncbi:histidinol phosphate phosphatase [Anoxybacter fermentans]|uniref:Histidinol-phosphatase n=1 Tax=Anoxybacter fermentans TaxID=1323375 RepID=A0A3Q9HRE1_9FIRM|nr:histidinol-phosphatase HisJ family protein [Anoxybacter fermentans]AZR74034.1 histidinol phosphate phosphatase [Anoxybacter fermentans]